MTSKSRMGYAIARVSYVADVRFLTSFGMTAFAAALRALHNDLTFVTFLTVVTLLDVLRED